MRKRFTLGLLALALLFGWPPAAAPQGFENGCEVCHAAVYYYTYHTEMKPEEIAHWAITCFDINNCFRI